MARIILVHGTFAKDTDWIQEGSFFREELRNHLETLGTNCSIRRFIWSGNNDHSSRGEASDDLCAILKLERNTFDEIYLIAHSHGANVAARAIAKLEAGHRPAGVITLGAPFLSFRPRKIRRFILLALMPFAIGLELLFTTFEGTNYHLLFVLTLVTLAALGVVYRKRIANMQHNAAYELHHNIIPLPHDVRCLCLTDRFDEAILWLRILTNLGQVFHKALDYSVRAFYIGPLLLLAITSLIAINWSVGLNVGDQIVGHIVAVPKVMERGITKEELPLYLPFALLLSTAIVAAVLSITSLLTAPLAIIAPWVMRTQKKFAFGGEKVNWFLTHLIDVTNAPPTRSGVSKVNLWEAWARRSLRHNWYYQDKASIKKIARYIAEPRTVAPPRPPLPSVWLGRFLPFSLQAFIFLLLVSLFLIDSLVIVDRIADAASNAKEWLTTTVSGLLQFS